MSSFGRELVRLMEARGIGVRELARRAEASDVGNGTAQRLGMAADDLAVAYPSSPPAILLERLRTHLGCTGRLLDARATLAQRRSLLMSGGWLSLLAATCLTDLHRDAAAAAYLRTAAQLAAEADHAEIAAWVLETQAWQALTAGQFRRAAELSQAAQRLAPHGSSAHIQATAQEARAWARIGARTETYDALARMERLVSPLPVPERPEHHYRYDPPKAAIYIATTLSWLGDLAAEGLARQVLAAIESADRPRPRRAALARLDLALALAAVGKDDEAAGVALEAVMSGYLAPVDGRRVLDVVRAVPPSAPNARELAAAYADSRQARHSEQGLSAG